MNSPTLRILFISTQPFFEWRGSSIRVKFNLLALESMGHRVDLLAPPIGADVPALSTRVRRVLPLPGVKRLAIGPSPAKLLFDMQLACAAIWLAIRHRYDVIHATEEGGTIAWLAARITAARCIYEKHSDPASYRKGGLRDLVMAAYRGVERFTSRRVDAVICTGAGLAQQARRYAPDTPVSHIPDIPSSLEEPDPGAVAARRADLVTSDDDVIVTYVGSFAVYQGIDLLFESIPRVLEAQPRARFLVIGGSAAEIDRRRQQLGRHADRVLFAGMVDPDRLPEWLSASDILLVPRLAGVNTPLKVLDYFKAAGAIVATDTVANRLLLDADTARLSGSTADEFAAAIGELVADPAERERLAGNGRRRYLDDLNFDRFRDKLEAVYRQLLSGKRQ